MSATLLDCKAPLWRNALKTNLQEGNEVDLANLDYTVEGAFCELLAFTHGMKFKLDAKNSIGSFRLPGKAGTAGNLRLLEMHRATILVVEDNEDHVFLLKHAFQKAGITNPLQVASTGEDAIAYLEGTGKYSDWQQFPLPAIVLLDLKLPGLSGFDVLKWVKQHPGLKALRVAMLTSSDLDQEIKMAYELGANGS